MVPLLSSASMPLYPTSFYQPFFSKFCSVLFPFYARKGHFIFQMMSAEGQTSGRFLDLLLCLLELPGVFVRQSGEQSLALDLGHSELDQLHWLHKWLTRLKSLLWSLGCRWLKVGGRQGYVSVQSVYQYSLYLSCHLVDLAVLFSVVQRPVLNCIKLYRLCKKLNVA